MQPCRHCGRECLPEELFAVHEGGGCSYCNGSPACVRCGHPRKHHRGTFGGGPPGCTAQVASEAGLALGQCGCPEYTTDRAAFGDDPPAVDVVELRLRRPGEPRPAEAPPVKPVRDLLDSGRRLRDLSEFDGVPWRPPS
jgi:hypothetical protein